MSFTLEDSGFDSWYLFFVNLLVRVAQRRTNLSTGSTALTAITPCQKFQKLGTSKGSGRLFEIMSSSSRLDHTSMICREPVSDARCFVAWLASHFVWESEQLMASLDRTLRFLRHLGIIAWITICCLWVFLHGQVWILPKHSFHSSCTDWTYQNSGVLHRCFGAIMRFVWAMLQTEDLDHNKTHFRPFFPKRWIHSNST